MPGQRRQVKSIHGGGFPPKPTHHSSINIVAFRTTKKDWQPNQEQLENQINVAIEDIRSILIGVQKEIGASDQYLLGILDVVADDYRAQLPTGNV
ncbi:MAG: hypothetical protein CL862_04830 [Cyanobium sp. NAT70]|nr:hypothetical protein [Cyanobium sp. NAT70]|tara:strand:+ start:873 stop:1157 length:285 start_codon:yes stop_codon:yes gene_type:complete